LDYTSVKFPKSFTEEFNKLTISKFYRSFSEFCIESTRNRLTELKD